MNFFAGSSPTGRFPSQPETQDLPRAHGRISWSRVTPRQQALLDGMTGDTLTVCGRTFTRDELLRVFNGHQLPKDPAVCQALDIATVDYALLERRVLGAGDATA